MKKKRVRFTIVLSLLAVSLVVNVILIFANRITTTKKVETTSTLFDLAFTSAEKDSLSDAVMLNRDKYAAIHAYELSNATSPAYIFSPVPANYPTPMVQEPKNFNLSTNPLPG